MKDPDEFQGHAGMEITEFHWEDALENFDDFLAAIAVIGYVISALCLFGGWE